ncbi:InlB B-repeat-containing protein [Luteolibacter luteus]|uniref:Bacterial repeat domain-containing protein n=1 Tax=Luteolibacter luteus TaxID=2728835 RepID=A0A858RFG5_9BACT|nr:hypothetical protein [Luteolibacter luteus]QJE95482.1 hypothetical protein HHL09_06700 [Luteolibacter luteus]
MKAALLSLLACCTFASLQAASVSLVNPSFEQPGTGRVAIGFDATADVPGWVNTGGVYLNSGVELSLQPTAAGGYVNASGYVAFLRGTDGGAYQATTQQMEAGQVYRLVWKAGSISSMSGTANQQVRLFRTTDGGTTRIPLATSNDLLSTTNQVFETYVLEYTATAADAGARIGIEIDNLATTSGTIGFDDFQLELNPSGPAPATGVPTLAWDSGAADDGTTTFTSVTPVEREYHFRIQPQASLNGGWRTVVRVAEGNANVYLRQAGWANTSTFNFKSDRATGDDGFVLRPDQFSAGQTWYLTVRAMANTSFTLFSGDVFVQDLGPLAFTDANANGQYDIGETILPSGSGAVTMKGEGIRFFKTTVITGTPAWSLWLNGDMRDIAVKKASVPYHALPAHYGRKQAGQMLVSPPFLGVGTDTYFISVTGAPGDAINLDSRIQQIEDMPFQNTISNVPVSGPPYRVYRTNVPVDQIAWDVSVTANEGDPNICVRRANVASEYDNDGYSEASGGVADSVTLVPDFLTNGTWFVTVYGVGAYNFTLKSGDPVVTPIQFVDHKVNDQTTRAGWRYYALTNIPQQLGPLGWELYLSNQVPGTQIALRRNKVPSRWQYRSGGVNTVLDTAAKYSDYASSTGFLQRPGHQADVWYVGVFTPQQPLGSFELDVRPIQPPTVNFDGSQTSIAGLKAGEWNFVKVNVPATAGILGWDVRVKNVSGAGDPRVVVCRNLLPSSILTSFSPASGTASWPSGGIWAGQVDWTKRNNESGGSPNVSGRRLVTAMGRPLEPGTYYVGVFNNGTVDLSAYVLESRGIGNGQALPVTPLGFSGGTSTISGLAPREARYYKVTIPENTPSWEFTVDPTMGEMMASVRRGHVPDFGAPGPNLEAPIQSLAEEAERSATVQKNGAERYVLLPPPSSDELVADDYYIAVVSEGQDPLAKTETGTGSVSGVVTSRGTLAVTHMGVAGVSGITQQVSLAGGQVKAFQYEVPEGTLSLEIYLENRTGNPWSNVALSELLPMPPPNYTATSLSYSGFSGGALEGVDQGGLMWNISNPPSGLNSITVRAGPLPSDTANFPDATAELRVVAVVPQPLEFNGGSSSVGAQQPGTWRYFKVEVPDTPGVMGWDVRLRNVDGGKPWVQIRKDYVPAGTETSPWTPYSSIAWPSGYQIAASPDWTSRSYEGPTSTTSVDNYRLITGMGRPLQPGTYYVGVYNYSGVDPTSYSIESSGIGEGQVIPIQELPYAGGEASNIVDLNPREAVYYKVTIPENTPSWEFTLDATVGEMMAVIRRGTIPDFGAQISSQATEQVQSGSGTLEVEVQKNGSERFVLLPPLNRSSLIPGDYYIAAISEGFEPVNPQRTGATPSSGIMTARGPLGVTDMGTATSAGVTRAVALAGGQVKLYRVTVPAGTESMEVRLNNRTGNPWISMVPGGLPPRPCLLFAGTSVNGYGTSGGQTAPAVPYVDNDDLMTVANPTPGEYTIAVRAACGATGSQLNFPDATGDLTVIANKPLPLAFNGGTSEVASQAAGAWKYFEVVVPPTPGVMGWDIRVRNVVGTGTPKIFVRRDQLPSGTANAGWTGRPSQAAAWASGAQWVAQTDWTRRIYDFGINTDVSPRRLVMGMGRPLEPGTYIVGVQNTSTTASTAYTIESRGIGAGMVLPITDLAFAGGSATTPNLAPREAAYYKVTIPANTPSWEFTLDPSVGEMMAVVRRGSIPDFGGEYPYTSDGYLQSTQPSGHREAVVQKNGPERFTVLPISGQDFLLEGDYYIAAISEGQNPASAQYTGNAVSTGLMTSRGVLAITDLGTVPTSGSTRAVTLAGGQLKAYQFTVPPDLAGVEIRLDERIGNPWLSVIQGSRLPKPSDNFQSVPTPNEYGFTDGQSGSSYFQDDNSITLVAPEPGVYSLIVRASANPASPTTAALDASASLVIRPKPRIPLNFSSTLNPGGGTNTDTRQITDGERTFYEVPIPATLGGQSVVGWILRTSFQQGAGSIKVYKTWGNSAAGISVTTRTAVIVPPFLTPGDTWFVEVTGAGLTNYTITSEPVTLNQPAYVMPAGHNAVFGDSGANLTGDRGIDLGQDDWHFYAVDVPAGNAGLLRTELQAINGNPNLYIREDGVPTTDHNASGAGGVTLTPRVLNSTGSEYGNWVPLDGRKEVQLRPGRWYLGVKATGTSNARYRLVVSNGQVNELPLAGGSAANQLLVGRDWRYYRVQIPMDAPVDWTPSFLQQVGDVVMFIRDTVPPGNAVNGLETTGIRSWQPDGKNQGPYSPAAGHDAPGSYSFTTSPLRPGASYYIGFRAVTDATFTVSSACSSTTIGTFPSINFYNGSLNVSVPPNSEMLYQIPVPPEATRMKWTSTHLAALQLRMEQGTLPASSGAAQHFRSTSANSTVNVALTPTSWPWLPGHTYFLRLVNTGASSLNLALTMNGKNALTEDEDSDGLPDAWEVLHFGNTTLRNGTADPDGDGVTNAVEFADGTNPMDIGSALYFVNITTSGPGTVSRSADLPKYPRGHALTLTPVPDPGLSFIGWTGSITGSTNPVAFSVTANVTANASFGIPLAVALDTSSLGWALGGHGLWYGQSAVTQDTVDAAQAGAVGHTQESWMETTVYGPGALNFRWKVSSQGSADFLEFHIDGVLQTGRISGEVDWTQKSYTLASGPHTLRWRYIKNTAVVAGADTGWVDTITWSGSNPYANWIASQFTPEQQADLLISGPDADPDGDGLINLLECAFNLQPMNAAQPVLEPGTGISGLPSVTATGSGAERKLRLEFIRRKGIFTYIPEVSGSLNGVDWAVVTGTPVVTPIDSELERVVVEDSTGSGSAKRFGRVRVESP